jgi:prepilin-type N-terminal cleavage/methylation domain-containing protein
MRHRHQGAFTLIELLIVVAIIAILALIAVPNFLEAQTRAKVSRTKNDLRTLSVAWEAYHVDWSMYPQDQDNWIDVGTGGGDPATEWGYRQVTTPVAYITSIPNDPFFAAQGLPPGMGDSGAVSYAPHYEVASEQIGAPASDKNSGLYDCYCMHGLGPDRNDDFDGNDQWPANNASILIYDPTNGTVSEGDIAKFGGMYRVGANWTYCGQNWRMWGQLGF